VIVLKNLSQFIGVSYRRSQKFYTERLKDLDVTSGQYMYIVAICENVGKTQDDLSQEMMIDKGTAARVLFQLEMNGFLTRSVNPIDRREYNIFPTDKAVAVYPEILKVREEWHQKLTENFSDIEREIFEKLLEKAMKNAIKNCE
jgi:DNA-binding MarR family transcriptional regulator